MDTTSILLSILGKTFAYVIAAALSAYGIFRFLTKKWIENKFAENLQDYKHEQQKEMSNLKLQIDGLFNRMTKIHDKEIEVLPKLWGKLCDTISSVQEYVNLITLTPDLNRMDDRELEEFLSHTKFNSYERQQVTNAEDKNKIYFSVDFIYKTMDIRGKYADFHAYFMANRIFLQQDLKELFVNIENKIWGAIIKRQIGGSHDSTDNWIKAYKLVEERQIQPILESIEISVQERLRFEVA